MTEYIKHQAKCAECGEIIVSERPGHFVTCSCGKSALDTDRWFPMRVRTLGSAILLPDDDPPNTERSK